MEVASLSFSSVVYKVAISARSFVLTAQIPPLLYPLQLSRLQHPQFLNSKACSPNCPSCILFQGSLAASFSSGLLLE
jgi:hypothetical protein